MKDLKDYQKEILKELKQKEKENAVLVLPVGAGKAIKKQVLLNVKT